MPLLAQDGQDGLGDVQHTEEIHFELMAHLLLRDFFDRTEQAVAGIVDDNVETTKCFGSLSDSGNCGGASGTQVSIYEPNADCVARRYVFGISRRPWAIDRRSRYPVRPIRRQRGA